MTAGANDLQVAIIGAGFSGICMAIKLKQAGITDFRIFEKTEGVSGTWWDNTYPGAACDVPSHLYSFSFDLNAEWPEKFSKQKDIHAYVERCIDKFGIRNALQGGTTITGADFDEESGTWQVHEESGKTWRAKYLVSGVGGLNIPSIPDIPGIETFDGPLFHSARWDHSVDMKGKRVALVGSAASAIQILPQLQPLVDKLTMFQRTPNYILPRMNYHYSKGMKRAFSAVPFLMRFYRWFLYWRQESRFFMFSSKESKMGTKVAGLSMKYMRALVTDTDKQKQLTPDYRLGCKRILISDDYYPAVNQDNVSIFEKGIERVTPNGIVGADGEEQKFDAIIMATGFRTLDWMDSFSLKGIGGVDIKDTREDGMMEAHRGVTVAGFPNYFILLGPNTGLGHNSIIFMIEQQVNYIIKCMKKSRKARYIDVKNDAMDAYNRQIQHELEDTVWASGCKSWYRAPNGKIPTLWPHTATTYWRRMRDLKSAEYNIVK